MNYRRRKKEMAFNELWKNWHMPVYKYCLHRLKDLERAEDCMQNTFYTLYESIEKLDINEHIGSWLFRVANNYVLKEFRSIKKEMKSIPFEESQENVLPYYEMYLHEDISDEQLDSLRKELLSKISRADAELLRLWYDEHRSVEEISEKLGISPSAVYKRNKVLCNKIKLLAKKITENF